MVAAYAWLMASGVMAGFSFRAVPPSPARVSAIRRHMVIQLWACALACCGFYAIFANKARPLFCHPPHGVGRPGRQLSLCSAPPLLVPTSSPRHPLQIAAGKSHFTSTHGKVRRSPFLAHF